MQNCARIPKYTPIATFLFGQYVTDGTSLSGVFLKCTPTGFEVKLSTLFSSLKIIPLVLLLKIILFYLLPSLKFPVGFLIMCEWFLFQDVCSVMWPWTSDIWAALRIWERKTRCQQIFHCAILNIINL